MNNRISFTVIFLTFLITNLTNPASCTAQGIPQSKLDSLTSWAKRGHSDGLIVLQGDKVLVENYFDQQVSPTYIASIGKALISIAITKLLSDGKIKSIDQPIADFYPEWQQGQKRGITLRMIMSHTSGLQNEKNARLELDTGPDGMGQDLVKLALAAEITSAPGTVYSYNNKAICLLPGIIEKASGLRMDKYFEQEFFGPMKIKSFKWQRDKTGNPKGHAGFDLLPRDLAKFGQLMLGRGSYDGKKYFETRWADSAIKSSQAVNPETALIWQRFERKTRSYQLDLAKLDIMKNLGVSDSLINALRSLQGKTFNYETDKNRALQAQLSKLSEGTLRQAMAKIPGGMKEIFTVNEVLSFAGFSHSGSWGNFLIIIPGSNLVIVRLVKKDKDYVEATDLMGGFTSRVFDLFRN